MLCRMLKSSIIHLTFEFMYCSFENYAEITNVPLLRDHKSNLAPRNREIVALQDYKSNVASKVSAEKATQ